MGLTISDSELAILRIIWEHQGEMMFSEIAEVLQEKNYEWKNNTILTFLARLVDKKILKVRKVGRRNAYIALLSEQAYLEQETKEFVGKVYEGEAKGLIATLLENKLISDKEIAELQAYWEQHKE